MGRTEDQVVVTSDLKEKVDTFDFKAPMGI